MSSIRHRSCFDASSLARASFALLALLSLSCGPRSCHRKDPISGDDAPRAKKPADREIEARCLRQLRAVLERNARCEGGAAWWGSVDRELEQERPFCTALARADGVKLTEEKVEACVDALARVACEESSPPECASEGTLPDGAACTFALQCHDGSTCLLSGGLCGKCARLPREGDDCTRDECTEGLFCHDGKCVKRHGLGEPCFYDSECLRTLRCSGDVGKRVCMKLQPSGGSCDADGDCEPQLHCELHACLPRAMPKPPGSPCRDAFDCLDFACVEGRCTTLGGEGARCNPSSLCTAALRCVKETCVLPEASDCH